MTECHSSTTRSYSIFQLTISSSNVKLSANSTKSMLTLSPVAFSLFAVLKFYPKFSTLSPPQPPPDRPRLCCALRFLYSMLFQTLLPFATILSLESTPSIPLLSLASITFFKCAASLYLLTSTPSLLPSKPAHSFAFFHWLNRFILKF